MNEMIFINKKKIVKNIVWLFFDKLFKIAINFFLVMYIARYFGPLKFGMYNYAISFIAIFSALSTLGMNTVIVREFIHNETNSSKIICTTFIIRILFSIFCCLLAISLSYFFKISNFSYIAILSITIFFSASDILKYWFESQVIYKYIIWIENSVLLISALLKLFLIYLNQPIFLFFLLIVAESILSFILIVFTYFRLYPGNYKKYTFDKTIALRILACSWPLIISSVGWVLFTRIDQIMIAKLLNDADVGLYSAAIRLSESTLFLPTIVTLSLMPSIISTRTVDYNLYLKKNQLMYEIVIAITLFMAIVTTFISHKLVNIILGVSFYESGNILIIHIWTGIFVAMEVVSSRFLLNEGLQKITMIRQCIGICINIVLNIFLIPSIGVIGAALASLISFLCIDYLFDLMDRRTHICFRQKTRAFLFFEIRNILHQKMKMKMTNR